MFKNHIIDNLMIIKYFIKEIRKISKYYIYLLVLVSLMKSIIPFIIIIMPKYIIDELLGMKRVDVVIYLIFITIILNFVLTYINAYLDKKVEIESEKVNIGLEIKIGKKIMKVDFEKIENPEILKLKESAIFAITNQGAVLQMITLLINMITNIFMIIGITAILSTLNFILIIFILSIVLINSYNYKRAQKIQYNSNQEIIEVNRVFSYFCGVSMDFSMAKDIRLFNMSNFIMEKIIKNNNKMIKKVAKMLKSIHGINVLNSLNLEIQNMVSYLYLCYCVIKGYIGVGSFTMYISATQKLSNTISESINNIISLNQVIRYLKDYKEFNDLKDKSYNKNGIILNEIEKIEFRNVSFKYPNSDNFTLKNINILIEKGEKLSIVGLNGAGKSTFIKLLVRLYEPTNGEVLINDINVKDYDYESLISKVSVIFQDFELMAFPIKENICFDEINEEQINKINAVLDKLEFREYLNELKNGIDTSIYKYFDSEGIEFSGGQAQKIAIARALFKDSDILILDEPTSALDPISEANIYNKFYMLSENKTTIFISHRLSSCRICDKIAVFKDGEIIQYGNHKELINDKEGLYNDMYTLQASNYC